MKTLKEVLRMEKRSFEFHHPKEHKIEGGFSFESQSDKWSTKTIFL